MTLRTPAELQARYPWLTYKNGTYAVKRTKMSDTQRTRRQRIVQDLNAMHKQNGSAR